MRKHGGQSHEPFSHCKRTSRREIANQADTRTTQLYDRIADVASLDEYGKVGI